MSLSSTEGCYFISTTYALVAVGRHPNISCQNIEFTEKNQ